MASASGVTDLPKGTCAIHDEVIDRLRERDERLEKKIDSVAAKLDGATTKIDGLGLTFAKWAGAFAVLTMIGMAVFTIAIRHLAQ